MKITKVTAWVENFELTRPYSISSRRITAVENILVQLETANGLVGLGCASPAPSVTKESPQACRENLLHGALDWLVGRETYELVALCRELETRYPATPAARAAVDMALHDLLARHLDIPLVTLLGQVFPRLPTSITIGIKSLAETLAEAEEYLGRGFRILKVKVGQNLEEDLERLHQLRAKVGAAVTIRVDPNQGYSAADVTRFVAQSAALDLEFLEQPLPVQALATQRTLPEALKARIAADENLLSERDALDLIVPPRACGIFNIKLMKCGGLTPARRIADLAQTAGITLMWGCMDESIISITAALHQALAHPATRYLDLDGSLDLARDVVQGGFILEEGYLRPRATAGLGVERI
ncbi:mandelate racemase/muconate lactonizing enzyme family protein [Anthocerotibacter panamensis]|uniref:mandelate racemase/muconate lactonizing enzyme family protein n=1 Tax=Anthocerotibacter panamensis TaxID=2857077 RepID=UPI001C4083A6|nr:dipeptide epimerase [Anthocerotibacter panamensis]